MLIKPITPDLYSAIYDLQNEVHAEYLCESLTVLTSKVYASPSSCFTVQENGVLIGYILALPYPIGEIPPLSDSVDAAVGERYNMFIHDCVVSPLRRKSGVAAKMIHAVENYAREQGFVLISLVAVRDASSYWVRHGWKSSSVPVREEYGHAVYMEKEL